MILDSSFLIDLLRGKNEKVKEIAKELDGEFIIKATTSISVMELWRGSLQNYNCEKEQKKVNDLLKSLIVLPFDNKAAKKAGEIEAQLVKEGNIIDLEDIMIAAIALSRGEPLLTNNKKHFERIKGLSIRNYI